MHQVFEKYVDPTTDNFFLHQYGAAQNKTKMSPLRSQWINSIQNLNYINGVKIADSHLFRFLKTKMKWSNANSTDFLKLRATCRINLT